VVLLSTSTTPDPIPLDCSDLAPCDFWPFSCLKHCPERKSFNDHVAQQAAIMDILMEIRLDVFVKAFAEWEFRLPQYINRAGDYV
jgi:hypothetical protein